MGSLTTFYFGNHSIPLASEAPLSSFFCFDALYCLLSLPVCSCADVEIPAVSFLCLFLISLVCSHSVHTSASSAVLNILVTHRSLSPTHTFAELRPCTNCILHSFTCVYVNPLQLRGSNTELLSSAWPNPYPVSYLATEWHAQPYSVCQTLLFHLLNKPYHIPINFTSWWSPRGEKYQ